MKTLILGLGNPILRDDGVGIRVARLLEDQLTGPDTTVVETGIAGLGLLDVLAGYDRTIIVDAIYTGGKAGQIYRLEASAFDSIRHAASPHGVNLSGVLDIGKRLRLPLPQEITIFAIEAKDAFTFGEKCTPEVEYAIPVCVEKIIRELD